MAYIGTKPTVGNFQICDAISVVNGQAAYTMQVGGVNVNPQSANHMIVSLNGTIQKPNSSFTVSGSTITFASNLVTNDVIDFIQILGDVLDLGVPSDATVTTAKLADSSVSLAKLTATGTKSSSTFLRGDNSFQEVPAGGITEADMFRLSASVSGDLTPISSNIERVDNATFSKIGTGMSVSSGVFSFPSTGLYFIQFNGMFFFNGAADSNVNALITGTANDSSYDDLASAECGGDQGDNKKKEATTQTYFNCTNVSTHKVRFRTASMNSNTLLGSTDINKTIFTFIRLGDSQ